MSGLKRYQNPDVYECLAVEYVVGTLRGGALRRFEQLMRERPYIRYSVEIWEQRLSEMAPATEMKGLRPSAAVWQAIQAEVGAVAEKPANGARFWQRAGLWQFATLAALTVALLPLLRGVLNAGDPEMPMPSYVAVLESDAHTPMMVTLGDISRRTVYVRVMEMPDLAQDKDIQLWAVHEQGSPVPVGLLNRNGMETQLRLSPPQWSQVEGARTFAISFEPKGGAPEGKPTGKIMYKGQCLDFI